MSITSNLRRQHTEILALASEIRGALQQDPAGIESIEKLLPALTGKIKIHLAMEDNALYPLLLDAAEAETRRLAADYLNEMGNFTVLFAEYHQKWNSRQKIKDRIDEFSRETQNILNALTKRITREEQGLYDVADRMK